ncbi:hypothetical protein B0H14DRAFT_2609183 [Mycena olivaceomarginata]|nr:hypothetical protein B0H14DRAFT_2609183 [Mycena olivaceomarginata]
MSVQSFIERSRQCRAHQSQPETPRSSSPDPTVSSPNPFTAPPTFTLPDNPATQTISLRNFGEQALKRIKLDTDSKAEFRTYIEILWAILFLPNIQWYAGTVENTIISMQQVMRNSNISDLPPLESTECDVLVKDVAQEYSVQRSTLKNQITETIGKKIDIATLTSDLLAHCEHIHATMGLYFRIALICHHCTQDHTNMVFWPNVDKALAEMCQEGPDAVVSVLQIVYEDDIKTHGDPAKSQHKTGNGVSTGSPKWLQQLYALAPLVQRFSWRQGTKCRRPASFDEEEEDNRDAVTSLRS